MRRVGSAVRSAVLGLNLGLSLALIGCTAGPPTSIEQADRSVERPAGRPASGPPAVDPGRQSQAALDKWVKPGEPGCSAAVGHDGSVVWTGQAGLAELRSRQPIGPDTVFNIGSVSKQFTATAVLLLVAEGKLALDDRLSRHLPGLPAWADRVTIAQLMHHVSGLPEVMEELEKHHRLQDPIPRATIRKLIAGIKDLDVAPGTQWVYSNTNYYLLADVVERRAGQPFADFVRERIFRPSRLRISSAAEGRPPARATDYRYDALNKPRVVNLRFDSTGVGGLETTPSELVRWGDNYRTGAVGGRALLRNQLRGAVSTTLGESIPSPSEVYGAGILRDAEGRLFHSGLYGGFQSAFVVSTDRRTAIAVTCNLYDTDIGQIVTSIDKAWTKA